MSRRQKGLEGEGGCVLGGRREQDSPSADRKQWKRAISNLGLRCSVNSGWRVEATRYRDASHYQSNAEMYSLSLVPSTRAGLSGNSLHSPTVCGATEICFAYHT
jgi:hypothetical protein